jgi:glycosyltransferase involved in cell wall biosynthesis
MNILHVIPGLTWERGGPTVAVCALARHQAAAGHQVRLLTTDQGARSGEQAAEVPDSVSVERLPVLGPDRVAYAPAFARALRARLRTTDVVHVHSIFTYPVHAALHEARAAGVPVVLRPCGQLHGYSLSRGRLQKRTYLALYKRKIRNACSAWHFTSEREACESWPWDNSPRFVVPNGIEPSEYATDCNKTRTEVARSFSAVGDSPYVLFLGRLHRKKRLDVLLEAFLAGAPRAFKLIVAGPDEGNIWHDLAVRWLRDRSAAARVVRLGLVTGREKALLLAGASLFALPSEHENFGIAALEALAAGTPVLLSPSVDLAEASVDAGVGYASTIDVTVWRERLASLLSDPARLAAAGVSAKRWAAEHYAWERIAGQLVSHYCSVLSGRVKELCLPYSRPATAEVAR